MVRAELDRALLSLEQAGGAAIRAEAADTICELAAAATPEQRPEFAPSVVRLLADAQEEVRCAGLALGAMVLDPSEAKELLTRHLKDPVVRVRVEAVGRLADLALPEARGALAVAMGDSILAVRFEAARGMAMLEHASGVEVLTEALDDPELRYRAAAALAQLGKEDALPPLRAAFKRWFLPAFDKTQIAGALASFGDADGIAYLFQRASRTWSMDRPMAVELLGEVKAPGARERLLEIVAHAGDTARGTAARALGRLGDPSVEPTLTALLGDASLSDDLRLDAAEGLLILGTESARTVVRGVKFSDRASAEELEALTVEYGATA